MTTVLALDLASVTGWAVGEPGGEPVHGSLRFASRGASHEAVFAGALKWMNDAITEYRPHTVVWEAPMPTSFKTSNVNTTTLLYGLPAVIGTVAYIRGVFGIRKAETRDVRLHFIGQNPKRVRAKPLVMQKCRAMRWEVEDDNEADALATWSYMCSLLDPRLALKVTPPFGRSA
jgi:crossover junction endodeoxyribonuclease RuvC